MGKFRPPVHLERDRTARGVRRRELEHIHPHGHDPRSRISAKFKGRVLEAIQLEDSLRLRAEVRSFSKFALREHVTQRADHGDRARLVNIQFQAGRVVDENDLEYRSAYYWRKLAPLSLQIGFREILRIAKEVTHVATQIVIHSASTASTLLTPQILGKFAFQLTDRFGADPGPIASKQVSPSPVAAR